MNIFKTDADSHAHSLQTLNLLANYDAFMDSITSVCDMGCGAGGDIAWWATKTYIDENGSEKPYNYRCVGVDRDVSRAVYDLPNLKILQEDFEHFNPNIRTDLIWSHDSFRFAVNPLQTLKNWNTMINAGGMLVLIVPQTVNIVYNRPLVRTLPLSYFNYNITNLLYMLAVNGFDCKAGHFTKAPNDPWLQCIAYKSEHMPMDPTKTTWYDLYERDLLPQSALDMIKAFGFVKQENLQTHWIDGQFCDWTQV